ncbi:MAG TPA: amidohydrolase [Pyrinomonadaceae bacterium]|nr:amidohydrolase [Pyrinomonadaceae bacterium]HMP66334.1 amidohydrolase [Pyrinomonadaceae bacterium]
MRHLSAIIAGIIMGCSVLAQDRAADLVIVNGDVWTMNTRQPRTEAVAIVGNRISAVGSTSEIKMLIGPETKVIDANGRIVLPGFNDAHVHFMAIGNTFSSLDLRNISQAEDLYKKLQHFSRFLPKGRWILGSGGNDDLLKEIRAEKLDLSSPDNPVFLYGSDVRSAIANSAAFKAASIDKARPGIVRERDLELIRRSIPSDHTRRWAEIAETASNYAASLGITSVQDTHSDDMAEVYRELERQGKLKTRVYDCISLPDWVKEKQQFTKSDPEAMVRTGCLKGFLDGDDDWTQKLKADVIAADKAGWQVAIHAIGAKPNRVALDIFEEAARLNGKRDRRFRLEHAEGILPEDMPRLGTLGVVASIQPYLFGGGAGVQSKYYSRLEENGAVLAMGSDAPMAEFSLVRSLRSTTFFSFTDISSKNEQEAAQEFLFRSYTAGSAFAEFGEERKGEIAAGKLADIVILSQDIPDGRGAAGYGASVYSTIVNGRVVYMN